MARDLYNEILAVPAGRRPPHYYDLLGLRLFENDGSMIHAGGLRQMRQLKEWQLHKDPEVAHGVQELLNEVSRACTTLEIPARKAAYDAELTRALGLVPPGAAAAAPIAVPPPGGSGVATALATISASAVISAVEMVRIPEFQCCPRCGAQMSLLALICIECGCDTRTGKTATAGLAQSAAESWGRLAPAGAESREHAWPWMRALGWGAVAATVAAALFWWLQPGDLRLAAGYSLTWRSTLAGSRLCQIYLAHRRDLREERPYLEIRGSCEQRQRGSFYTVEAFEQPGDVSLLKATHFSVAADVWDADIQSDVDQLGTLLCQRRLAQAPGFVQVLANQLPPDGQSQQLLCAMIRASRTASPDALALVEGLLREHPDPTCRQAALDCLVSLLIATQPDRLRLALATVAHDRDPLLAYRARGALAAIPASSRAAAGPVPAVVPEPSSAGPVRAASPAPTPTAATTPRPVTPTAAAIAGGSSGTAANPQAAAAEAERQRRVAEIERRLDAEAERLGSAAASLSLVPAAPADPAPDPAAEAAAEAARQDQEAARQELLRRRQIIAAQQEAEKQRLAQSLAADRQRQQERKAVPGPDSPNSPSRPQKKTSSSSATDSAEDSRSKTPKHTETLLERSRRERPYQLR